MSYTQFLLFGALGGLARAFVGIAKHFKNNGEEGELSWKKILLSIVGSGVVGAVVGLLVDQNPVTACASGYAGIDVIEALVKLNRK